MVLAKIRAGEKIDHYETIRQRKDGTRLTISLTVSPIRNERGEIVGASKIARDITERARLLAAAREHAANTEKLGEVGAVVASTLDRESDRPESHRHRDGADARGVRRVFLQRDRSRIRRRVHAVHAVGRAAGSVREVSPSARDGASSRRRFTAKGRCGWTT